MVEAGDLRRYRTQYDITVMGQKIGFPLIEGHYKSRNLSMMHCKLKFYKILFLHNLCTSLTTI